MKRQHLPHLSEVVSSLDLYGRDDGNGFVFDSSGRKREKWDNGARPCPVSACQLKQMYRSMNQKQIGLRLGASASTVCIWMRRYGIQARAPGGTPPNIQ